MQSATDENGSSGDGHCGVSVGAYGADDARLLGWHQYVSPCRCRELLNERDPLQASLLSPLVDLDEAIESGEKTPSQRTGTRIHLPRQRMTSHAIRQQKASELVLEGRLPSANEGSGELTALALIPLPQTSPYRARSRIDPPRPAERHRDAQEPSYSLQFTSPFPAPRTYPPFLYLNQHYSVAVYVISPAPTHQPRDSAPRPASSRLSIQRPGDSIPP
ncbi:unnamed protein product [Boreogadus saida]